MQLLPLSKQKPRRFFCNFPNCGKSFTRAEHLQRHELNHRDSPNTCRRCSAHFARQDLLERHMERHAQRDKEAGGEGLGVLVTRKRCWRDENGNISTKRPASSVAAVGKALEARRQRQGDSSDEGGSGSGMEDYSSGSSGRNRRCSNIHDEPVVGGVGFEQSQNDLQLEVHQNIPSDGFLVTSASPTQQEYHLGPTIPDVTVPAVDEILASCQADFDNIFGADITQSFTMPFTTLNDYNWLFDELRTQENGQENLGASLDQDLAVDTPQLDTGICIEPIYSSNNQLPSTQTNEHEFLNFEVQQQLQFNHQDPQSLERQLEQSSAETTLSPDVYYLSNRIHAISPAHCNPCTSNANTNTTRRRSSRILENSHSQYIHITTPPIQYSNISPYSSEPHCAPSTAIPGPPTQSQHPLPDIDEVARQQVLGLIIRATTSIVTGESSFNWDDPLLSLSALQNYLDLFFSRFNAAYPLIHRPSFDPSSVNTLLLVNLLMLGATYGGKDAHQMAVKVHDVLRGVLVSSDYFHATPELWVLQTVLLIEVFGKSRAGMKQHDMAHLFHGLLINLIRRSDCQSSHPPGHSPKGSGDLDRDWKEWIVAEEKKRLALLCFLWDVQHAVLFSQSLCMSAFELRCPLPSDSATWEANSAKTWYKTRKAGHPPPLFLPVIKSFLNPGRPAPPLNSLSRVLVLHGLMSIMWDMRRRDQTSLGFQPNTLSTKQWQTRIAAAYDAWKADYDQNQSPTITPAYVESRASTLAVYHASHIILLTDILDLQIYAGARTILGKPVQRSDYDRSWRAVKAWSKTAAARSSVWHAANLIRAMHDDNADDGRFHYPWCLYLSTLTCWAFCFTLAGTLGGSKDRDDKEEDSMVWDAKTEMKEFVEEICKCGPEGLEEGVPGRKFRTAGLVVVVSKYLSSVRWALVHEGVKVLRGFVVGRLIKEYEVVV